MFSAGTERIALLVDSSCAMSAQEAAGRGIELVPLRIAEPCGMTDDGIVTEGDALSEFTDAPGTLHPDPVALRAQLAALAAEGCTRAVYLCMGAALGGSVPVGEMLAEKTAVPAVTVWDSRTADAGLYLLALRAAEDFAAGHSVQEVLQSVEEARNTQLTLFTVPSLAALTGSGYIAPGIARKTALTKKTPVLYVDETGGVGMLTAHRTEADAADALAAEMTERFAEFTVDLCITHAGNTAEAEALADRLCESMTVRYAEVRPAAKSTACHTGSGLVGVTVQCL